MLTENNRNGEFLLSAASGQRSFGGGNLVATATLVKSGTLLGIVTASGAYKPYAAAAADGSQTVKAILRCDAPISTTPQKVAVVERNAEVIEGKLTGLDTPARAALATLGIVLRKDVGANATSVAPAYA
jgi:hypothetical protein